MELKNKFILDFKKNNDIILSLLSCENLNFKNKNIKVDIKENKNKKITISIFASTFIDIKIAITSIMNSLEIINKTLKI